MDDNLDTAPRPSFSGALRAQLNSTGTSLFESYYSNDKQTWVRIIKEAAGRRNIKLFKGETAERELTEAAFRDIEVILAIQKGGQKAVIAGAKLPMAMLTNQQSLFEER
ncbi:hypothetical protein HDU81_009854 [Chytriomyces hyalinus]|nr:hypothetical protein HDU81_009854 [Chytriomyces hyalinus]